MQKFIITLVAALTMGIAAPTQLSAQDNAEKSRPQLRRDGNDRRQMNPDTMALMRAKQIAEKCSLTEAQQTELTALFKEQFKNGPGMMRQGGQRGGQRGGSRTEMTKEQRDSMRTAMDKQRKVMEESLKKILGEEKFAQYQKDEQARREQMRRRQDGRRGNGPGNGPGRPAEDE